MNQFLSRLSKSAIVALTLIGGVLFIVLSNPPHSLCDTQVNFFKEDVGDYLFVDKLKQQKSKGTLKSKFQKNMEYCRGSNATGGCYEFFFHFRNMLKALNSVSHECQESVGAIKEVKSSLWETIELMVRIAWGERPPKGIYDKYSWMDTSDMNLFCHIKSLNQSLYPEKRWVDFREKMMRDLPGADQLSRNKVWELTIFSDNCVQFQ